MNQTEALMIFSLAVAASPAQKADEHTPELWAMVLAPYLFADARTALAELAGEQEWIHVSHIVKRVKRIRRDRLGAFGTLPDPPEGTDDPATYRTWFAETVRQIADGGIIPVPAIAAAPGHVARREQMLGGLVRSVD